MQRRCLMKVVADANVLFASLLKDSLSRKIWFSEKISLCSPAFVVREVLKHKQEMREKYGGSEEEFNLLLQKILERLILVPDGELTPYLPAASSLTTDQDDWLYLACALKEDALIWSEDKEFKKQKRVAVKTASELGKETGLL